MTFTWLLRKVIAVKIEIFNLEFIKPTRSLFTARWPNQVVPWLRSSSLQICLSTAAQTLRARKPRQVSQQNLLSMGENPPTQAHLRVAWPTKRPWDLIKIAVQSTCSKVCGKLSKKATRILHLRRKLTFRTRLRTANGNKNRTWAASSSRILRTCVAGLQEATSLPATWRAANSSRWEESHLRTTLTWPTV